MTNSFISFSQDLKKTITAIVHSSELHARWLNTLSFLENCGARKIAAYQHPTYVKKEILKHAAEEFRHAHHLKRQIEKVSSKNLENYSLPHMLGGIQTLNYLKSLDIKTCRYLKTLDLPKHTIKETAYLLVTYAIEMRAEELYPIYEEILRKTGSRVTVKSIVLEEKEHLKEMQANLSNIPLGFIHADNICAIESQICKDWLTSMKKM